MPNTIDTDNRQKPSISGSFEVDIDKLVYGGAGLGRHRGKVVFVPFTVPGDRAKVRALWEKKNFIQAELIQLLRPGSGRVVARCRHFGSCGGCQLQHLEYPRQLEFKRRILEEILHHRLPETKSLSITMKASPQNYGYRSRARMQLRRHGRKSAFGFFKHHSHKVEDVEMCPLFRPSLNRALSTLRQSEDLRSQGSQKQEWELACSEEREEWSWRRVIPGAHPSFGKKPKKEAEGPLLKKQVAGFEYALSPSAFFQANDFMVADLVTTVRELSSTFTGDNVLDLFAGVGLFSLPLARKAEKVVAVDSSPQACALCFKNARAAGLPNIQINCSGALDWMEEFESKGPPPFDLIVLNPPRAGAGNRIMTKIARWQPDSILYISCDPNTLTRDLLPLTRRGYFIDFVQGLDLFPQTYHFETIVRIRCGCVPPH